MNLKIFAGFALIAAFALSACSSNLCVRKEKWLESHCTGTEVAWSHDSTCETAIDKCDQGHLAQMEAYVTCLEAQNVCSLETMGQCQQAHPGGVNLSCTGP